MKCLAAVSFILFDKNGHIYATMMRHFAVLIDGKNVFFTALTQTRVFALFHEIVIGFFVCLFFMQYRHQHQTKKDVIDVLEQYRGLTYKLENFGMFCE